MCAEMGQVCPVAAVRVVCQCSLGVVVNLGGGEYDVFNESIALTFTCIHFGLDNGALPLPIGSDKKAVRHECGTAGCGVRGDVGDFGAKGSVSESGDGCPLRLRRRVVGGVMAAGHDQVQQGGGHIGGFGNEPAQSLDGVTTNLTAYL